MSMTTPNSRSSSAPESSSSHLQSILAPVAHQVAEVRAITNGIVVVVHNPGSLVKRAMKKLGAKVRSRGTFVFGYECPTAAAALGHDPVTRRWCAEAPEENQIKVFLVAGDGTALLTLNFSEQGIITVEKKPDLYPV